MDIDKLTIGEARAIFELFGNVGKTSGVHEEHPFVGEYVICRCNSAGVHAGYLVSQKGDEAVLRESRRLWSWTANSGVALSGVAATGLKTGKVDAPVEIALTGVIETIVCSDRARDSIINA